MDRRRHDRLVPAIHAVKRVQPKRFAGVSSQHLSKLDNLMKYRANNDVVGWERPAMTNMDFAASP
jgi:hypothetical protein